MHCPYIHLSSQINHNLRSFGGLTRNDVQCMMYNQSGGLPDTIRNGLNHKVDTLLKVLKVFPQLNTRSMYHSAIDKLLLELKCCYFQESQYYKCNVF